MAKEKGLSEEEKKDLESYLEGKGLSDFVAAVISTSSETGICSSQNFDEIDTQDAFKEFMDKIEKIKQVTVIERNRFRKICGINKNLDKGKSFPYSRK